MVNTRDLLMDVELRRNCDLPTQRSSEAASMRGIEIAFENAATPHLSMGRRES
jgi:hypothetical protein